jgi:protein-tyrosine phosphatase
LLTSYANTPAAHWADIVLLTAPVATAPWEGMAPLRVAQLTVIDMLCVAIAGRADADLRDFRARYDALLARHMLPGGSGAERSSAAEAAPAAGIRLVPSASSSPVAVDPALAAEHERRRVEIEGVENARHLGGLPLAGGGATAPVIVRSGALWQISHAGIERLRELDVTDIVDLRYDAECRSYPTPDLDHAGIAVIRAPMYEEPSPKFPDIDDLPGWISVYRSLADNSQPAMRTLIETIAAARGAVLTHCRIGGDRSGIAVGLLLDLVGVDEANIIADYSMSPHGPGFEVLLSDTLARIRERWGSAEAYFLDAGVDADTLERARARMRGGDA